VSVHQHLLQGRAYKGGKIYDSSEGLGRIDSSSVPVLEVGLYFRRALVLWSRWLYGQPMWRPQNCESSGDDLEALVDTFDMCVGVPDDCGRDHEGMNACLDAIGELLVHDFGPSNHPWLP
jgi:hypothetical protein